MSAAGNTTREQLRLRQKELQRRVAQLHSSSEETKGTTASLRAQVAERRIMLRLELQRLRNWLAAVRSGAGNPVAQPAVLPDEIATPTGPWAVATRTEIVDGVGVLHVLGEIDLVSAPLLLRDATPVVAATPMIVLDLDAVTYVDAAGLHVLDDIDELCRLHGGRMGLACSRPGIRRILEYAGIADRWPLFERWEPAVRLVREGNFPVVRPT